MARQSGSSLHKVTLPSGSIRWRFTVDLPPGPDGKRRQRRYSFPSKSEAEAEQSRIRHGVHNRTHVDRSVLTVDDVLDDYIEANSIGWKASTANQNASSLRPVRVELGSRIAQQVTAADLDRLVRVLQSGGRNGRSARTVQVSIVLLRAAFELAVERGTLARNPAAKTRTPKVVTRKFNVWTPAQVRAFREHVHDDRLAGAWYLSTLGMRRGEVLGARWSDLDIEQGVLHVTQNAVAVGGRVVLGSPKTERGLRSVPLPADVLAALERTRRATLGQGVVKFERIFNDRRIAVDEAGEPVAPYAYTRMFNDHAAQAGLPRIRLHDLRHSAATTMLRSGMPPYVVASILGHDVNVLLATYAHVLPDAAREAIDAHERAVSGLL